MASFQYEMVGCDPVSLEAESLMSAANGIVASYRNPAVFMMGHTDRLADIAFGTRDNAIWIGRVLFIPSNDDTLNELARGLEAGKHMDERRQPSVMPGTRGISE